MEISTRPQSPNNLFNINKNCWRISSAEHAAPLIDCANFYRAIHQAIAMAKHSVFIMGWEIDSQVRLLRGEEEKKSKIPSVVRDLLSWKAEQHPEINFYLCRWDASIVFFTDRDMMPELVWANNTPENVHICADGKVPMAGSHHQKIILVDDELVFTGGMDIARQRWDQRDHRIVEPERNDVLGTYGPYHDVQVMMDGPITEHFAELVRDRWRKASGYEPIPARKINRKNLESPVSTWPAYIKPVMTKIDCAISRTLPKIEEQEGVQEIHQMYLDLINRAEKFIYIENQFLTLEEIALALNKRMKQNPDLKVLLVSSYNPQGIFERESLWAGRIDFKKILEEGLTPDRVRMTCSGISDGEKTVYKRIHSKVFIVDDQYLTISSSNLNHRSMVIDSECDVTFFGQTLEQRKLISFVRNDLLAEHTGLQLEEIENLFKMGVDLDVLMNSSSKNTYSLQEIDDTQFTNQNLKSVTTLFADPDQPLMSYVSLEKSSVKVEPFRNPRKHMFLFTILLILSVIAAVIYLTDHEEWFKPERIKGFLEFARESDFALPLVCLVYIVGGFFLFPVTVLSLMTAAVFGVWWGPVYGMVGSLVSAALMFLIGHVAGLKGLRRLFGDRIRALDQKFHKSGILGVAALRFIPLAPYSLVNLAAGISSVTFLDFMVGTFLGFLPGLVAKGLVGDSLAQSFISPTRESTLYLVLGIILWVALIAVSYYFTKRWQKKHPA